MTGLRSSIVILDGSLLLRELLAAAFDHAGFEVSHHDSFAAFLEQLEQDRPAVALLVINDPDESPRLLGLAHQRSPGTRLVAVMSAADPGVVSTLVRMGVSRLLDARSDHLQTLIEAVAGDAEGSGRLFPLDAFVPAASLPGRPSARLSPREREVLGYLSAGHDNLKIAAELGICERTVKAHVSALYRKLALENRTQLALRGLEYGLAPPKLAEPEAARAPVGH